MAVGTIKHERQKALRKRLVFGVCYLDSAVTHAQVSDKVGIKISLVDVKRSIYQLYEGLVYQDLDLLSFFQKSRCFGFCSS